MTPTRNIDGDVTVGRNINAGGSATVQGDVRIGHNLTVSGWLEAKNIKGVNKGIFAEVEDLRRAYPNPADGWMAGVGISTPFATYIGSGGVWVRAQKEVDGDIVYGEIDIVIDNNQIEELNSDLESIQEEIAEISTTVGNHDSAITTLRDTTAPGLQGQINTLNGNVTGIDTRLTQAESDIDAVEQALDTTEADVATLRDTTVPGMQTQIGVLSEREDATEGDVAGLKERVTLAENDIDAVDQALDTAQADIIALQGRAATVEGKVATLETELNNATNDIGLNQDAIDQLRQQLENYCPIGNDYNVTAERIANSEPNSDGNGGTTNYDTLETAVAYAISKGVVNPGVHITFSSEANKWHNYSYVGTLAQDPSDLNLWQDFGGGSATGNIINVNEIAPLAEGYYSRGTAALAVPEELRTGGRKMTFMSAAGTWQTWQYIGTTAALWADENYWRQEIKSVSFNGGAPMTPDAAGNVDITYAVDVDQSLNAESVNPISNAAVTERLNQLQNDIPAGMSVEGQLLSMLDGEGNAIATVTLPAGGGGSTANPTAVEITIVSDLIKTIKEGDNYELIFQWRHYNVSTGFDTQYGGRAELIVNGSTVYREDVAQGKISIDVTPWLSVGSNTVRVRITADDGTMNQSALVRPTVVTLGLTSTYDLATITSKGQNVAFRFVVTGSGTKTVAFTLDGEALEPMTVTTSGTTSVKNIPTTGLSHGAHRLQVYAERVIGEGSTLRSNVLTFDLMVVESGVNSVIIATQFDTLSIEQYQTIVIPYAVYDPTRSTADVAVSVNGVAYQSANVDRTTQRVSYRARNAEDLTIAFTSGGATKEVAVEVTAAEVQVNAETDSLALYLSSSGRTNTATNASEWSFTPEGGEPIVAEFHGCNFDSESGWKADSKGLVSLHLAKGAMCEIPYKPFERESMTTGKTIEVEFKVTNCFDQDATLISCYDGTRGFIIKSHSATMSSGQESLSTDFKEGERMRIGFVIEPVTGSTHFMHMYVDGIHCGVLEYNTQGSFVQVVAGNIMLGNENCELDIYNIRVYDNALTMRQMVDNYIADMDDTELMFEKVAGNNIINEESTTNAIDYDKAVELIPCMTLIGELPTFKGDKKKNTKLVYEDRAHPEYSFSCEKVQNDVQGTSSQYYPRKNWKIKFLQEIVYTRSGESASKYALRAVDSDGNAVVQKAVKTFCLKADFAESSGTHNTGAANFINEVLKRSGVLTPPQQVDDTVRTTVYGHPILLFHQANEQSERVFIGKYNFNNDKSTQETFGFENIAGYNKGMVNRDDYLVYDGTLAELNAAHPTWEGSEMYLLSNNHLAVYVKDMGWQDMGEMWMWDAASRRWTNTAGGVLADSAAAVAAVAAGELVENNCECWEFTNNGHPMCLCQESDFDTQVTGSDIPDWFDATMLPIVGGVARAPYWAGAFEPRYPDNEDLNREYANGKKPKQLKRVLDWLAELFTARDGAARFAAEYTQYFHRETLLSYDLIREALLMADQGAKNMMWAFFDGLCYPIFYDNDTILGLNNEGRLQFGPYVEPHDTDAIGKNVFNGHDSALWTLLESACSADKAAKYATLVSQGGLTYDRALYWFNTTQSDKWSETVYNSDSKYKYIDSFGVTGEDGSGTKQDYLDIAQGSRSAHRKWMLSERLQYINAKRCTGTYRDSYVALRANTAGTSSVPAVTAVTVTAAQDWYFGFRFSGNAGFNSRFIAQGDSYTFTAPEGSSPNDTECYVHQADRISHLGDLSLLYPSTLQVGACRRLEELIVGNPTEGYVGKLNNLSFGEHPLLRLVDIRNCPKMQTSLDLSKCTALQEVRATGSGITSLNIAKNAPVTTLSLPATISLLVLDTLPLLTYDGLTLEGYTNIGTVNITDCSRFDGVRLLGDIMDTPGNVLARVKLTGVHLQGDGQALLDILDAHVHGVDDATSGPQIYGTYELTVVRSDDEIATIEAGIVGLTVTTGLLAYVNEIDKANGEYYAGAAEVDEVTQENLSEHLAYFNGETYEEYEARVAAENISIHDYIKQ